jgi:glutamate-1-semialdehyde 2,1-aminomutase
MNSRKNFQKKISKSLRAQKIAKKIIPGMNQLLSKRPDMFSYGVWPGYYKKSKGTYVWDLDGNKYLDMSISAIGASILGYANEIVDKKVINSIKKGVVSSLNCEEEINLAKRMLSLHKWAQQIRYSKSGGEAVAMSVRVARACTKKEVIAFCGYHGWHDWYLAANIGKDNLKGHLLEGLSPSGVPKGLKNTAFPFRYNEISDLEKILKKNKNNVAAIVMEPLRSFYPKNNFLQKVRNLATKYKVILIFDEITSGFRLCAGGAHLKFKVNPDMAVFGKALGNGYPISCILGKKKFMKFFEDTFISSTAWTERTGVVAANAMIDFYLKNKVNLKINKNGKLIKNSIHKLALKHNLDISIFGYDSIVVFVFNYKNSNQIKALFIQMMMEKKILASNVIFLNYAQNLVEINKYLSSLDEVFQNLSKIIKENINIKKMLFGKESSSGFKRIN